jgi:hypothetical protein
VIRRLCVLRTMRIWVGLVEDLIVCGGEEGNKEWRFIILIGSVFIFLGVDLTDGVYFSAGNFLFEYSNRTNIIRSPCYMMNKGLS